MVKLCDVGIKFRSLNVTLTFQLLLPNDLWPLHRNLLSDCCLCFLYEKTTSVFSASASYCLLCACFL